MGQSTSREAISVIPHTTIDASAKKLDQQDTVAITEKKPEPKSMSFFQLLLILRPFFWPSEGSDGALVNRARAISTWLVVGHAFFSLSFSLSIYYMYFPLSIFLSFLFPQYLFPCAHLSFATYHYL